MKKNSNAFVDFFASVKLALFLIFILASTSIIGTILPQNEPLANYVQRYGQVKARFFQVFDLHAMYSSWWFTALLVLLCMNLIVCSIKRLPHVWRTVFQDNLTTSTDRLQKMRPSRQFSTNSSTEEAAKAARTLLSKSLGPLQERQDPSGTLLFSQKGAWTRFGVYSVHFSILIIFIGAIIGGIYGYKGYLRLPIGSTQSEIIEYGTGKTIPLGFSVRCNDFSIAFYKNGTPREFRSELTVLENGQEMKNKSIIVNHPLDHGGFTFYQSSYEAENLPAVLLQNNNVGIPEKFPLQVGAETRWAEEGVTFGILNTEGPDPRGNMRLKIWFSDNKGAPSVFWMNFGRPVTIERPETTYNFLATTLPVKYYATVLQVAKDPGVWWVYAGCTLMLVGLCVVFFLSHQRVWIYISKDGEETSVLLCGSANKNKLGFQRKFDELTALFENDPQFTSVA